jgi:tRNA G18 (ribose-2'-O)-methylase SpoU
MTQYIINKLMHDDILALRLTNEQALRAVRHPVSVMLVDVRSLYNVGSIFRTCDSALVKELVLCGFTPYPPRKEIEKTALGAVDTVPWRYEKSALDAITEQKQKGEKVFAVEITDKKREYTTLQAEEYPMCLVLGNELTGLDNKVINACDDAIEIPMFGVKHSLNVAVAAGIVIYEAVERIRKKRF